MPPEPAPKKGSRKKGTNNTQTPLARVQRPAANWGMRCVQTSLAHLARGEESLRETIKVQARGGSSHLPKPRLEEKPLLHCLVFDLSPEVAWACGMRTSKKVQPQKKHLDTCQRPQVQTSRWKARCSGPSGPGPCTRIHRFDPCPKNPKPRAARANPRALPVVWFF